MRGPKNATLTVWITRQCIALWKFLRSILQSQVYSELLITSYALLFCHYSRGLRYHIVNDESNLKTLLFMKAKRHIHLTTKNGVRCRCTRSDLLEAKIPYITVARVENSIRLPQRSFFRANRYTVFALALKHGSTTIVPCRLVLYPLHARMKPLYRSIVKEAWISSDGNRRIDVIQLYRKVQV